MSEIKPVYLDIPRYCENCELLSRSLAEAVREYERLREAIKRWVDADPSSADYYTAEATLCEIAREGE